jgi:DNA modification methylase
VSTWRVMVGDCRETMATLPADSVQCCVTSPPYWGLRDYGHDGQLGLEQTPEEYVARMVDVFREVRRVLRDDGVLWLNLGDSYNVRAQNRSEEYVARTGGNTGLNSRNSRVHELTGGTTGLISGLKPKDLVGIPWRLAFALQADGWYLRSEIIWHKPNPMPESVTDRPTKAHEQVFLLSKSARYFYDADAIAEDAAPESAARYEYAFGGGKNKHLLATDQVHTRPIGDRDFSGKRNARTVWTIATQPYSGAHFATFPPELAERCIKAGSRPGDTVLDPFGGSGTTGMVATGHGRAAILCELNPEYVPLIRERCGPMLEGAA